MNADWVSELYTPREFLRSLKSTGKYSNCVLIKVLTGLMLNHTFLWSRWG